MAGLIPSIKLGPIFIGSNQLLSLVVFVPSPVHEVKNFPKSSFWSELAKPQPEFPPCNWPIVRWSWLNNGYPEDAGSVTPKSQEGTCQWLSGLPALLNEDEIAVLLSLDIFLSFFNVPQNQIL